MKRLMMLVLLYTTTLWGQTPYWLSGDGYNIYNGNRGNILMGPKNPFNAKLAIDPGNEAYALAMTSDLGEFGNYVQVGMLGRNMDILQGRMLFNLYTSNPDLKYAGYDFRFANKSAFFISGEGNVGIGIATKTPPVARLQIEGGTLWTVEGYKRSLQLGNQDAVVFGGTGYKFGLGTNGAALNFFASLQEKDAHTQAIMSLQPTSVTIEGDLIVKGNVYSSNNQGVQKQAPVQQQGYQTNGYTTQNAMPVVVPAPQVWSQMGSNIVFNQGNVGIGTSNTGSYKLAVEGMIGARKVVVTQQAWADYVFSENYNLRSLEAVEQAIQKHKHLPGIPSAKEVEAGGVDLGSMQAKLLEKIEELTLYVIELNKQNKKQAEEIELLKRNVQLMRNK